MSGTGKMEPADVPDELVGVACAAVYGGMWAFSDDRYLVSRVLAAALPEFERQVREKVAKEIEQVADADGDGSSWDGGMSRAIEIARGES